MTKRKKKAAAKRAISASAKGELIATLLDAGILAARDGGWVLADAALASELMRRRDER